MKTSLTGIKPTGQRVSVEDGGAMHIGNYLGMCRPALKLQEQYSCLYFIADYHALTTQREPGALRSNVYDLTAAWLACGLDPERVTLFRQSDVLEVFELTWVLACVAATGQLERGHAYKDSLSRGEAPNAGIFNYPLLMAADIVLYDTDVVPVGADQRQHLEVTRDLATRINHLYGEGTLVVPEALITEAPEVPGPDGRKMSKGYGNTIPLFLPPKRMRKALMKFKSDSTDVDAPKQAEGALIFELYKLFASSAQQQAMQDKLQAGGYGWGHAKQDLAEAVEAEVGPMRERFIALRSDEAKLDGILQHGAERARKTAASTMARVRDAVGIR